MSFGISPQKRGKTVCTIPSQGNPIKAAAVIREVSTAKPGKSAYDEVKSSRYVRGP